MDIIKKASRIIFLILGILFLTLGILGIFLPVLPTTPFVLLSAACFSRSSEKLHRKLLESKWLGSYIKNYREGRGIPLFEKVVSISLLWVSIGFSVLFFIDILIVKILLLLIASGVTIHLLRIKTYKKPK